jgi:hypothetical protein
LKQYSGDEMARYAQRIRDHVHSTV